MTARGLLPGYCQALPINALQIHYRSNFMFKTQVLLGTQHCGFGAGSVEGDQLEECRRTAGSCQGLIHYSYKHSIALAPIFRKLLLV